MAENIVKIKLIESTAGQRSFDLNDERTPEGLFFYHNGELYYTMYDTRNDTGNDTGNDTAKMMESRSLSDFQEMFSTIKYSTGIISQGPDTYFTRDTKQSNCLLGSFSKEKKGHTIGIDACLLESRNGI